MTNTLRIKLNGETFTFDLDKDLPGDEAKVTVAKCGRNDKGVLMWKVTSETQTTEARDEWGNLCEPTP